MTTMLASELVEMLRRQYLPEGRSPGGIFAAEIAAPSGDRRADAIWAPWSIAGGSDLVGHEVKVARSDVLAELADPMKAEPWAQYCSQWWLVVAHPNLIDGLSVPTAWGVMSPPSGRRTRAMTVLRPAPRLNPANPAPGWRRIAVWEHWRLQRELEELRYKVSRAESDATYARQQLAEAEASNVGRDHRRAALVGRIVMALEQRGQWTGSIEVDDVVSAILDLDAHRDLTERARRDLAYLVDEARRMAKPLEYVARELEQLAKSQAVPA